MQVVPSGNVLGARIEGLDLSRSLEERAVEELVQVIGRYSVLCFPRQRLTPRQHRDFAARLAEAGADGTVSSSPEEFAALVRADTARYAKIVKDIGLKID